MVGMIGHLCDHCLKPFTPFMAGQRYCSHRCYNKHRAIEAKYKRKGTPMQELYNCKHVKTDDKGFNTYRITKFDKHLDPKYDPKGNMSSYLVSAFGCDCPQGHNPSCRHRKMLPFFIDHEYVDTEYFFVWETHQWFKGPTIAKEAREANGKNEPARPGPITCENMPDATLPEKPAITMSHAEAHQLDVDMKKAYRRF